MLLAHPVFAALVSRWPRRRFVTVTYRFFMLCLVAFFVVLNALPEGGAAAIWTGRSFFIWTAVFNLFVVSVFWSFMTDIYRERQGRRLFGLIGVAGTLGADRRVVDHRISDREPESSRRSCGSRSCCSSARWRA